MSRSTPQSTRTEALMALTVVLSLSYLLSDHSGELPRPTDTEKTLAALASALDTKANDSPINQPLAEASPETGTNAVLASSQSTGTLATSSRSILQAIHTPSLSDTATKLDKLSVQMNEIQALNSRDMKRFAEECNDWTLPCASVFSEDMNARSRKFGELEKQWKQLNANYREEQRVGTP